jgi:predicted peptidase
MNYRHVFPLLLLATAPNAMHAQNAPTQPSTESSSDANQVFEARTFEGEGGKLPYRLLKPLDYDKTKKYPLVLFLHGAGERGSSNDLQLKHGGRNFAAESVRKRYPAFVIAPQCAEGKKWVEVPWDAKSHTAPADPGPTMKLVYSMLEALRKEFSVDDSRLYVMGLSMGGYGTWDMLQRRPDMFAAGVPICGGGDPAYADKLKSIPIWAFHGDADPAVAVSRSRDMIQAIREAGGRPVYTEYEGVGHDSWTRTFDNQLMWDWLFAQHK